MTLKKLLLIAIVVAAPAMVQAVSPRTHVISIYSAHDGVTNGDARLWAGYSVPPTEQASYPGSLVIEPGGAEWQNFVAAAQAKVPYEIRTVKLVKSTPSTMDCGGAGVVPAQVLTQMGASIRLNWPLLYEVPETTWTVEITYRTDSEWDDDGEGPNSPSTEHVEAWIWMLESDPAHLKSLVSVLHDVPCGVSGVPMFSDEALYRLTSIRMEAAAEAYYAVDLATAAMLMADAELYLLDALVNGPPTYPNPTGAGTGCISSIGNPAACRMLQQIEYLLASGG